MDSFVMRVGFFFFNTPPGDWLFFSIPSNEGTELKLQCLWDSTQPYPTNNKAELEAVCTAIKVAEQQGTLT